MDAPKNIDAERAVLGAMLLDKDVIGMAVEIVTDKDFYSTAHQIIYRAIVDMDDAGKNVDVLTLTDELHSRGLLKDIGGAAYIVSVINDVPTAANISYYANIVKEHAQRRVLINMAQSAIRKAHEHGEIVSDIAAEIETALLNINTQKQTSDSSIKNDMATIWEQYLDRKESKKIILSTGYADMDRMIGGWIKGEHIIVAARPGVGKTSLGLCFARNTAHHGGRALLFTLEQPKDEIIKKLIAQESMVSYMSLDSGVLTEAEKDRVWKRIDNMYELNVGVLDGRWSVHDIRRRAIREKREKGLDLVVVDFLTKLQPGRRYDSLSQETNDNAKQMEDLAVELRVPVITLAQLNREVEKRINKRPILSDIREAGEEYASKVLFIYRDDYHNHDTEDKGKAEVIIAKNRRGPVGTVKLAWIAHATTFCNLMEG